VSYFKNLYLEILSMSSQQRGESFQPNPGKQRRRFESRARRRKAKSSLYRPITIEVLENRCLLAADLEVFAPLGESIVSQVGVISGAEGESASGRFSAVRESEGLDAQIQLLSAGGRPEHAGPPDGTERGKGLNGSGLEAFSLFARWANTTNGNNLGQGDPTTLTWSIVPDGTDVGIDNTNNTTDSNLVSVFNILYQEQSPWPTDYRQLSWFTTIRNTYDRWAELSGLTFLYEPQDDGALHNRNASPGQTAR
jgi:hypothetical protein